jgi:hypothetical protein
MNNLVDQAGKLMQASLAVIGAAVLGAILVGFTVNFVTTLFFGKRLPTIFLRWIRILSALASGVATALVVFSGTGGLGIGGGYGSGEGGAGVPTPEQKATLTGGSPDPVKQLRVGITILGGSRVHGEAFYQIDNEPTPKSLKELQSQLSGSTAGTVALRIYDDSVSRDHAAVTELIAFAERGGWKVVIEEFKGQSLPPEAKRS